MTEDEKRDLAANILEGTTAFAAGLLALIPGAGTLAGPIVAGVGAAGGRLIRAFGDDAGVIIDRLVKAREAGTITDDDIRSDDAKVHAAIAGMYEDGE